MDSDNSSQRIDAQSRAWKAAHTRLMAKGIPCGIGSTPTAMRDVIRELPRILKTYQIQSISDVGCGVADWIKPLIDPGVEYHGYDLMPDLIEKNGAGSWAQHFTVFNVLSDQLPRRDLILCRDLLIHLCTDDLLLALENFKRSQSKYLLASTYPRETNQQPSARNVYHGGGCGTVMWNLESEPFSLPAVDRIRETHSVCHGRELILVDIQDLVVPLLKSAD